MNTYNIGIQTRVLVVVLSVLLGAFIPAHASVKGKVLQAKPAFRAIHTTVPVRDDVFYLGSTTDQYENIWTASSAGLWKFDGATSQLISATFPKQYRGYVGAVVYHGGLLYIGTLVGLITYDPKTSLITDLSFKSGDSRTVPVDERVAGLRYNENNNTMLLGFESAIGQLDLSTGLFTLLPINLPATAIYPVFTSFVVDNDNNIWAATFNNGVVFYNQKTRKTHLYDRLGIVNVKTISAIAIAPEDKHTVIVASNIGLLSINRLTGKVADYRPDLIGRERIASMIFDTDGGLWVSAAKLSYISADDQVTVYEPHRDFSPAGQLKPSRLYIDKQATVFAFVDSQGGYRTAPSTSKVKNINLDFNIKNLLADHQNNTIWLTGAEGVRSASIDNGELLLSQKFGESSKLDRVSTIHSGLNGFVWVASRSAIYKLSKKNRILQSINIEPLIGEGIAVSNIVQDLNGDLWIATFGDGIYKLNPNNLLITPIKSLSRSVFNLYPAVSLFVSPDRERIFVGHVEFAAIISVKDSSVIRLNNLPRQNNLNDELAYSYHQRADKKQIFIAYGSDFGVAYSWDCDCQQRISLPKSLLASHLRSFDGNHFFISSPDGGLLMWRKGSQEFRALTYRDGLTLKGASQQKAVILNSTQALYLSGTRLLYVDAERFLETDIRPSVELVSMTINEENATYQLSNNSLKLHSDQRNIEFTVSANITADQSGLIFYSRLEGYDKTWRPLKTNNPASNFTNLDPGQYKFEVYAVNGDITGPTSSFQFSITPPFWQTPIAYGVYIVTFSIFIVFVFKIRLAALNAINKQLNARVKLKTKQYEDELSLNKEHLTQINSLLSFKNTSMVSWNHDLKTSLQVQSSELNRLKGITDLNDELGLLVYSHDQIARKTEQFLSLIQLQSMKDVDYQIVDCADVLKALQQIFTTFATSKDQTLTIIRSKPHEPVLIRINKLSFENTVSNVLSNAIKHAKPGTEITIALQLIGENCQITINNKGTGLSAAMIPSSIAFETDGVSGVTTPSLTGHGLGLKLIAEGVKINHGAASISVGLLTGTTVTLSFERVAEGSAEIYSVDRSALDKMLIGTQQKSVSDLDDLSSRLPFKADRATILLVDDSLEFLQSVSFSLSDTYNVRLASDGELGLKACRENAPDLILTDFNMPKMNGFELLKAIKADESLAYIPVLVLTAVCDQSVKVAGLRLGADDVINKPASMEMILNKIKDKLSLRNQTWRRVGRSALTDPFNNSDGEKTTATIEHEFASKILGRLNQYIAANLPKDRSNNLRSPKVARHLKMTSIALSESIKGLTDFATLPAYINDYKLTLAHQALPERGMMKMYVFAEKFGFTGEQFPRKYKEKYSVAPSTVKSKGLT